MRLKYEKAAKTGKVNEKSSVSKQVKDSDDGDVGCTGPKAGGNSSSEIIEENEIINPGEFTGDDFVHFILLHID